MKKGTLVRIRTTNGGDAVVKLLEDYRPTYSIAIENYCYAAGHQWVMPAGRIKSIEVVFNYWTAPLTDAEVEDIRGQLAFRRTWRTHA